MLSHETEKQNNVAIQVIIILRLREYCSEENLFTFHEKMFKLQEKICARFVKTMFQLYGEMIQIKENKVQIHDNILLVYKTKMSQLHENNNAKSKMLQLYNKNVLSLTGDATLWRRGLD